MMKRKKPWSYRRLCALWGVLLALLLLFALDIRTPRQALRDAEQAHSLAPTQLVLDSARSGVHIGNRVGWMLSANKTSLLFGFYQNYRPIFTTALDYDDAMPYCADLMIIGTGGETRACLFGAVTDPNITELHFTLDTVYSNVTLPYLETYTVKRTDMVYRNGTHYFVLPFTITEESPNTNPYIARVLLYDTDGRAREYSFDKPKIFSEDYAQALQSAEAAQAG